MGLGRFRVLWMTQQWHRMDGINEMLGFDKETSGVGVRRATPTRVCHTIIPATSSEHRTERHESLRARAVLSIPLLCTTDGANLCPPARHGSTRLFRVASPNTGLNSCLLLGFAASVSRLKVDSSRTFRLSCVEMLAPPPALLSLKYRTGLGVMWLEDVNVIGGYGRREKGWC